MVLEGTGTMYPLGHPEKAVTVRGGEMVTAEGGRVSKPEKVDVKLVLATSALIVDFAPLANLPLILTVVDQQAAEQQLLGSTTTQPLAKNIINVIDVTNLNTTANPVVVANTFGSPTPSITPPPTPTPSITPPPTPTPSITPPPTPSKFGTPATITSPNPYLITSGTTITTDPSITTNGVTDFGKIYRGPTDDGAFTLWAYGSTSAFDIALNLDSEFFSNPANLPLAVFKFQSLSLDGNPIIDTTNGVTRLGLIAVDGITSGAPGGTLTFAGLDGLYLGTVNGSIDLTSDISFANLGILAIYARGSGSNLTINSPISNIGELQLAAEGSVQLNNPGTMSVGALGSTAGGNLSVQIGGSLLLNGTLRLDTLVLPGTTLASGANVTLNVGNNFTNSSSTDISRLRVRNEGAHIGTGGNISMNVGNNLMTAGDFDFTIQNTTGQIDNGGNITVATNGSISTGGEFNLLVENYDFSGNTPGHIGTGGNISIRTGGDLSAQSVNALINNRSGGQIDSPVSLTLSIGGALTTSGNSTDPFGFPTSLFVVISTRFDNSTGNPALASTVGGDAILTINADSASIGGNVSTVVSNSGSTLNGNAFLSLGITHDVSVQGEADMEILNDADIASPLGGMLHGSAAMQLSSNNFTANALFAQIDNRDGGVIDSNAVITFDLNGNFAIPGTNPGDPNFDSTVPGEADILISNQKRGVSQDSATTGGTIGGNALIQLSAASASTAGALDVEIDNFNNSGGGTGGTIGENAAINLNVTNTLQIGGAADFLIQNEGSPGGTAGTIGGDATINVSAANVTANSLLAQIDNSGGGSIGATTEGGAIINMNVSGAATVTNGATVAIYGSDGATFAAIDINGGTYNVGLGVGGTFLTYIDGNGTITFNNASAHADVLKAGVFGANGVLNVVGGMLSADTELKLYAPGSNGQLNFVSNVTLGGNSLKILAANSVTIFNNVVVTIGGPNPADVYTNNANYTGFGGNGTTTGTFAGAGANAPQPLSNAPPFGTPTPAPGNHTHAPPRISTTAPTGIPTIARTTRAAINVSNTEELMAMLDGATVGPDGKIAVSAPTTKSNLRNLSRTNMNGLPRGARQMLIHEMRDRSITRLGGRRAL
jgi:hypothetical protein